MSDLQPMPRPWVTAMRLQHLVVVRKSWTKSFWRRWCDHGGTYTANLVGVAAAKATLTVLKDTDALKLSSRWARESKKFSVRSSPTTSSITRLPDTAPCLVRFSRFPQRTTELGNQQTQNYMPIAWNLIKTVSCSNQIQESRGLFVRHTRLSILIC